MMLVGLIVMALVIFVGPWVALVGLSMLSGLIFGPSKSSPPPRQPWEHTGHNPGVPRDFTGGWKGPGY